MSNRHICHNLTFFFNDTATTEIYTLSLHDALPVSRLGHRVFLKWKSDSAGKPKRKLSVRLCQPSGRQRMRLVEMNNLESLPGDQTSHCASGPAAAAESRHLMDYNPAFLGAIA